jgi:hypothetical protein
MLNCAEYEPATTQRRDVRRNELHLRHLDDRSQPVQFRRRETAFVADDFGRRRNA